MHHLSISKSGWQYSYVNCILRCESIGGTPDVLYRICIVHIFHVSAFKLTSLFAYVSFI